MHWVHHGRCGLLRRAWQNDGAAQIVEFAVALPLLVLFVVGIFDFSSAFTLKQKLTNAARDAARNAAAGPANDLTQPELPIPVSVSDAFLVATSYLSANKISTCGILPNAIPTGLTWKFTGAAPGCPPAGITLTINRGYYFPSTGAGLPSVDCTPQTVNPGQLAVVATCVSIQYGYRWQFGRVASLFGNSTLPSTLSAVAVAINEN